MKTGKQLEEVQTKYAEAMAEFGLERGVKSEKKTSYYRRIPPTRTLQIGR